MSFQFQADPVLASDTYAIIAQVTKHLQSACPSLSPGTVLRMAEGFELHIRARATSRQDYVNRVNAGLIILLQSARNGTLPNLMPDPTTDQPLVSPLSLQVNHSQYHSTIPTPRFMANGQEHYSALQPMLPNLDYTPPTMATPDAPVAPNVDLSVPELDIDLVAAAPSNDLQMDTRTASTRVSPANLETGSRIMPAGPVNGQQHHATAPTAVPTSEGRQPVQTQQNDPEQGTNIKEKDTESPSHQEDAKPTVRTTRRTSRARASRQSKRASPAASGLGTTPPATRSKARKNPKRSTRKRSTRGRKQAVKPREDPEPPTEENGIVNSLTPQNSRLAQTSSRADVLEAAPSLPGNLDATRGQEEKRKGDIVFEIAQQHINQKRNGVTRNSSQPSPNLGSELHPSSTPGLPISMSNLATPSTNDANISLAAKSPCNYAGSNGTSMLPNSMQVPIEGEAKPPTAPSEPNLTQRPFLSSTHAQRGRDSGENVRFCPNGEVEIDDGIRVSRERIIIAAATLGVMLTTRQLQCMKKAQALMILVKASQQEMVQANGMMHFLGSNPILEQRTPEEERRHQIHPQMMGNFRSQTNLRSTHPDISSPAPQPSSQTGLPLHSNEQGGSSRPGVSLTGVPELSAQPGCAPGTTQKSFPMWRFASDIPEVQSRLRKFQMDYRKYLCLLQQELLGARARASDNFLRYLRCCINLLAMNPTQVRGVSVEVIDSIERFLRSFLSQYSKSRSKTGQPSQPVRINTHDERGEVPMESFNADSGPSALQNAQRSDPQGAANPFPIHSHPSEDISLPSGITNGFYAKAAVGTTDFLRSNGAKHPADVQTDVGTDQITLNKGEVPNGSEPKGLKRKNSPNHDSDKSGKRIATRMANGLKDANIGENRCASGKRDLLYADAKSDSMVAPAELIDITDETRPPIGVAVFSQRDSNGNMFNLVRLSDRPGLEEVLQRLRFMLNCAMKLTTCYISVSEGREEDDSRRLEEVVVSLEPKQITSGSDEGEDQDQPAGTSLSLVDLINAECAEARKRYGSLTVQMMEEFRRPVFRGILRYNERPFPRLELRVAGGRKGEPEVRGYERPPMGWVGVLEQVRKLFCSSLEGGKGVEEMIRRWIRTKEDFNGWMELRERAEIE